MKTLNKQGLEDWTRSDIDEIEGRLRRKRYESAMRDSDKFDAIRCPSCGHRGNRVNTVLLPRGVNYAVPQKYDLWPVQVGCGKRYELVCLGCDATYDPEGVVLLKRFGR